MKLGEKEKIRANKTKEQLAILHDQGYKVKEATISMLTANIMGLVFDVLLLAPILALYHMKFGYIFGGPDALWWEMLIVAFLFFATIIIHEGIHALCMYFFNGKNKSLIEFGIQSGNPYCTCQSPINKGQYLLFALMPTLVLGCIFILTAFTIGKLWWVLLMIDIIIGGGGDFTIIWKLLQTKAQNAKIVDHPYKCGLFVLSKDLDCDMFNDIVYEIDNIAV